MEERREPDALSLLRYSAERMKSKRRRRRRERRGKGMETEGK